MADDKPDALKVNPIFAKIKPVAGDTRKFVCYIGYISQIKDGNVRLHPGLDLGTYYEIPKDAIVWAESADPDQASSPTTIVVESTVKINFLQIESINKEASFLSGAITHNHMKAARSNGSARSNNDLDIHHPLVFGNMAVAPPGPPSTSCRQTPTSPCTCFSDIMDEATGMIKDYFEQLGF